MPGPCRQKIVKVRPAIGYRASARAERIRSGKKKGAGDDPLTPAPLVLLRPCDRLHHSQYPAWMALGE